MALLAHRIGPPLVTVCTVVGLTFAMSPEHHERSRAQLPAMVVPDIPVAPPDDVIATPAFADARPWNHGGMVMGLPATHDRITHNALTDLLSGLFAALRGLAA